MSTKISCGYDSAWFHVYWDCCDYKQNVCAEIYKCRLTIEEAKTLIAALQECVKQVTENNGETGA